MKLDAKKIAGIGLLTAIVVVLQLFLRIKFGTFDIATTLVPIVIGAALYGKAVGAWLGFVFGMTVLLSGDATLFLGINPLGTVETVLLKGALAGLAAGAVYQALEKRSKFGAAVCAAITAPVVNTGIFLRGCYLFFLPSIKEMAEAAHAARADVFIFTTFIGLNFILEFSINLVLASTITRLIDVLQKRMR